MIARLMQWLRTLRQIHALSSLDDRILRDIGVDRDDIAGSVRGNPRCDPPTRPRARFPDLHPTSGRSVTLRTSGCDRA
jgi:hypothetical protein